MAEINERDRKATSRQIDILFQDIKEYRGSEKFMDLLNFCARFKTLSAYNAMLVNVQMPSAKYVLTVKDWSKKFGMRPKRNARPLVVLMPFSPVEFLYEVGDVEPIDSSDYKSEKLAYELAHPYETEGYFDPEKMGILEQNLPYCGIHLDPNMRAGSAFAAELAAINTDGMIELSYKKQCKKERYRFPFQMSLNSHLDGGERFVSICHELGHYFCHHLPSPGDRWWKQRKLSTAEEEFEAEAVAYLVTQRCGITDSRSAEYLSGYFRDKEEIPNISVDAIMLAVASIEELFEKQSLKDTILYKKDPDFKMMADVWMNSVQDKKGLVSIFRR